jgi:hypothetical protein
MNRLHLLHRPAALATAGLALLGLLALGGCTTTSLVLGVAGIATDTSVTWEVVKHVHAKMTEGDPRPCAQLTSVDRALNPRCGEFVPGSLRTADLRSASLGECPLTVAARDVRLWPVLPELLAKGARAEACAQAPLVALAQANDCPDLSFASPDVKRAIAQMAHADRRAVHHDVVRWLSCPQSRAAGLDATLDAWLASGALAPGALGFSPLGALHPGHIGSPFAQALEAAGHRAADALGGYVGERSTGFEEALRTSDWAALDWWLARQPQLVNRVPPRRGDQLAWLPLARVLVPSFLAFPDSRADMVGFLLARGADPAQRLPADPGQTVASLAIKLKSPLAGVLAAAPSPAPSAATQAAAPQRSQVASSRRAERFGAE